jgi:hypothetical protein
VGDANFQQAINVTDSGTTSAPVRVSNNTIDLQGLGSAGIAAVQFTGTVFVRILNNSINVPNRGLAFSVINAANLQALVQGNDFHNESHGVDVFGDGTNAGPTVDLGGGALGSLGGNNFRGLSSAIELTNTGSNVTIFARQNIFTPGVNPSTVAFDASHGAGFCAEHPTLVRTNTL